MGTTGTHLKGSAEHEIPRPGAEPDSTKSGRAITSQPALNFNKVNEAATTLGLEAKLTAESSEKEVTNLAAEVSRLAIAALAKLT